ncbi:MAG: hypothetical protein HFJ38_05900 [Bacilli bacterium]|nr:hypothetical protein [Bacilli bacterium]
MLSIIKKRSSFINLLMLCLVFTIIPAKPAYAYGITGISAISTANQTVYSGPSTSYATVGSIGSGEQVYILDKEAYLGWYHIVYTVNNSSSQKCGYVPTSGLRSISGTVYEQIFNGCQGYSTASQNVYSSPSRDIVSGSISNGEGVTVLVSNPQGFSNVYFIEYSTSSGPKRGYVYGNITKADRTGLALVTSTGNLYYGYNSSIFGIAGTVYPNEYVTVLAKNGDWVYVEYNTNSGRKRGYFSAGHLKFHTSKYYNDFYDYHGVDGDVWIDGVRTVYSGPGSTYVSIGSVGNESAKIYTGYMSYNGYYYVLYDTASGKKSGWIALNLW